MDILKVRQLEVAEYKTHASRTAVFLILNTGSALVLAVSTLLASDPLSYVGREPSWVKERHGV